MNKITRRRHHAQIGAEYVAQADAANSQVCQCGATRDEHDIAPDFRQPCEATGCKDFTLRGTK